MNLPKPTTAQFAQGVAARVAVVLASNDLVQFATALPAADRPDGWRIAAGRPRLLPYLFFPTSTSFR